jgi:hypothetical protein
MNLTDLRMEDPKAFNQMVAEKVMGWELANRRACGWGDGPPVFYTRDAESPTFQGPDFADDANHDYKLLRHVRRTWSEQRQLDFGEAIEQIWRTRNGFAGLQYMIGDYAHAALRVVTAKGVRDV